MLGSYMRTLNLIRWELFSGIHVTYFLFRFLINCISKQNKLILFLYFHCVNRRYFWSHSKFCWEILLIEYIFLAYNYHKVVFKLKIFCPEHCQLFQTVPNSLTKYVFSIYIFLVICVLFSKLKVTLLMHSWIWCTLRRRRGCVEK